MTGILGNIVGIVILLIIIFIPLFCLAAIVYGIVALVRRRKSSGGQQGQDGIATTGILLAIGGIGLFFIIPVLGILAAILLPAVGAAREKANMVHCVSNLKQIGVGLMMYAEDNHGSLPGHDDCRKALEQGYGLDAKLFECPRGDVYRFLVDGQKIRQVENPSRTIMALCTSKHHKYSFVPVLYADGHVETTEPQRIADALEEMSPGEMPVLE